MGMSSMVNKFNADAELLDDLVSPCIELADVVRPLMRPALPQNDHWTAKGHKVR
jgi:hypothetical protein